MSRYIDADELKERAVIYFLDEAGDHEYQLSFQEIDRCPTADVAPVVHGRWSTCTCSVCGQNWGPRNQFTRKHYKFCPHCGAKMDEEETE